jgi:hypothetical protein
MKKLLLLTALAALSACSQKAEESKETAAAPAEAATPAPTAPTTDSGTQPGTYDVKMADGSMASTVINADGTYVDTGPKGEIVKGLYARKDGKDCFDPEGEALGACWSVTNPGADGSFTATSPEGTVVTVTPRKK